MQMKSRKVKSIIHPQVLPAIHLEDPSEVHVIKKRSLDQQLRIKLYYDESVYRFVASLTMKILKHHLCHLWSNTNIEQVRPSTSIELYYDESVYRFVASLTKKILKHLAPLTKL